MTQVKAEGKDAPASPKVTSKAKGRPSVGGGGGPPSPKKLPSKQKDAAKKAPEPASPKKATKGGATAPKPEPEDGAKAGRKGKKEDAEAVEVYRWWEEQEQHPDGQHWLTLEHNGVLFPPEYVPHGRRVRYQRPDGTFMDIPMDPDEEEVATMFAVMREQTRPPSDYYVNPVFRKNFFADWLEVLNSDPDRNVRRFGSRQHPIKQLDRVNFDDIWQWHVEQKEIKKALTREQKAAQKKVREEVERPNRYCLWDGKRQPVGNFRIEPPGLFRGRGKHPLMGKLKKRVQPEDIVINIGKGTKVPDPPPGRRWKEVRHDNTVTWLANWTENVNGNGKYVMLAASSMVKGKSDHRKFEKARTLGEIVDSIRTNYRKDWKSPDVAIQQRAVALYFIDVLALRCGHEKGEDEAETFGACSLQCGHINLDKEDHVVFDFLGKDSIRYYNEVKVEPEVHALLKRFVKGKTPDSDLFDRLRPEALNSHLKELMPGLTAKVFRTYNASFTLDREIHESPIPKEASLPEKIVMFNAANTKVALLCNHQRSVTKSHQKSMAVFQDKLTYARSLLERLLATKELVQKDKKHGWEKARVEWEAAEDQQQREWLEKCGTDEEKDLYREKGAVAKKVLGSSSPKKRSKDKKKDKAKKGAKKADQKGAKKADKKAAKKEAKKSSQKAKKSSQKSKATPASDSEADSDAPLVPKAKKGAKPRIKHESDSGPDSDAPLTKSSKKTAPKASPAKMEDSDSDAPLVRKSPKAKGKGTPSPGKKDKKSAASSPKKKKK
jgi:DNA topoisomerase-1